MPSDHPVSLFRGAYWVNARVNWRSSMLKLHASDCSLAQMFPGKSSMYASSSKCCKYLARIGARFQCYLALCNYTLTLTPVMGKLPRSHTALVYDRHSGVSTPWPRKTRLFLSVMLRCATSGGNFPSWCFVFQSVSSLSGLNSLREVLGICGSIVSCFGWRPTTIVIDGTIISDPAWLLRGDIDPVESRRDGSPCLLRAGHRSTPCNSTENAAVVELWLWSRLSGQFCRTNTKMRWSFTTTMNPTFLFPAGYSTAFHPKSVQPRWWSWLPNRIFRMTLKTLWSINWESISLSLLLLARSNAISTDDATTVRNPIKSAIPLTQSTARSIPWGLRR